MPSTSTKFISFETLKAQGDSAVTVIQLMMACNDLSFAEYSFQEWKKEKPNDLKYQQIGALMYFIRIQLAHLNEAFKVIKKIRSDSMLMYILRQCNKQTQQSFYELEKFLPGGSNHSEFKNLIGRLRDNLAFHYDESGKLIKRAIADRASRAEAMISSVTGGDEDHLWHFKIADDIIDSIVVRQIWKIPREADGRVETDKVLDRVRQIDIWFVEFSKEFVWRYCKSQ